MTFLYWLDALSCESGLLEKILISSVGAAQFLLKPCETVSARVSARSTGASLPFSLAASSSSPSDRSSR